MVNEQTEFFTRDGQNWRIHLFFSRKTALSGRRPEVFLGGALRLARHRENVALRDGFWQGPSRASFEASTGRGDSFCTMPAGRAMLQAPRAPNVAQARKLAG